MSELTGQSVSVGLKLDLDAIAQGGGAGGCSGDRAALGWKALLYFLIDNYTYLLLLLVAVVSTFYSTKLLQPAPKGQSVFNAMQWFFFDDFSAIPSKYLPKFRGKFWLS